MSAPPAGDQPLPEGASSAPHHVHTTASEARVSPDDPKGSVNAKPNKKEKKAADPSKPPLEVSTRSVSISGRAATTLFC